MSSNAYTTACLSIGLASAWAPTADAAVQSEIRYQTNLVADVQHARVMLGGWGSGGGDCIISAGTLPGLGSGAFTSELEAGDLGSSYAMIGVSFGSGGGAHLVVSAPGLTYIGMLFEEAFPGWSEQLLIDQLLTDNPAADAFLTDQFLTLQQMYAHDAVCTGFSAGVNVGTVNFSVVSVPAPGAGLLGAMPLCLLSRRRRR